MIRLDERYNIDLVRETEMLRELGKLKHVTAQEKEAFHLPTLGSDIKVGVIADLKKFEQQRSKSADNRFNAFTSLKKFPDVCMTRKDIDESLLTISLYSTQNATSSSEDSKSEDATSLEKSHISHLKEAVYKVLKKDSSHRTATSLAWSEKINTMVKENDDNDVVCGKYVDLHKSNTETEFSILPAEHWPNLREPWILGISEKTGVNAFEYEIYNRKIVSNDLKQAYKATYNLISFSLPMQLIELRKQTILTYLQNYCKIKGGRHLIYDKIYFDMNLGARREANNVLRESAHSLLYGCTPIEEIDKIVTLLNLRDDYRMTAHDFQFFMALFDRLFTVNITELGDDRWALQADALERMDFRGISIKLCDYNFDKRLMELLRMLEIRSTESFDMLNIVEIHTSVGRISKKLHRNFSTKTT